MMQIDGQQTGITTNPDVDVFRLYFSSTERRQIQEMKNCSNITSGSKYIFFTLKIHADGGVDFL